MPNVLGPRDLVFRPDNKDETVPHQKQAIKTYLNENSWIYCLDDT